MADSRIRLAIWDAPTGEFFLAGANTGAATLPYEVRQATPRACEEMLRAGAVDIALLPTTRLLQRVDDYEALAGLAFSSWDYPFAKLVFKNGLEGPTRSLAVHPDAAQEAFVAQVVLQEHYDMTPDFVAEERSPRELIDAPEDAALIVGNEVPAFETEHLTMDLGREWHELAHYPMVWGLFATRKEEATPEMIRTLAEVADAAEEHREDWIASHDVPAPLHDFFAEDLGLRLGRLATASLTELRQYLFYFNLTDEVPDVPFFHVPDEDEEDHQAPDARQNGAGLRENLFD